VEVLEPHVERKLTNESMLEKRQLASPKRRSTKQILTFMADPPSSRHEDENYAILDENGSKSKHRRPAEIKTA
jgi:hypothetical protein